MKRTVQQSPGKSIGQTPDPSSEIPDSPYFRHQHWSDAHWEEIGLRPAIENRLARVDRALQSMGAIHELLTFSFHAGIEAGCVSSPALRLSPTHQEGLHCAFQCLFEEASLTMGDLRDNTMDCWGNKGGRA